jgi:crossover junction endodeoxyribonuclease RusA
MFTLPYPPSVNSAWRAVKIGKFVRVLLSKEGRLFRIAAQAAAKKQNVKNHEGELAVTLRLFRPRRSGDTDNRIKPVLDALQGIAYDDDKTIGELHVYRFEDKANPRVEVEITERKP